MAPSDTSEKRQWIDDEELEDVKVKWNWSNFDGNDNLNGPGTYNFTVILTEEDAKTLLERGWTGVKENAPYEEGDPPEWTLKINISYKYEAPKIYLIKERSDGTVRKYRVTEQAELHDIRRDVTDQIDVIITPSRWVQGTRTGVTAYTKEMYVKIRESRFASKYGDIEEI